MTFDEQHMLPSFRKKWSEYSPDVRVTIRIAYYQASRRTDNISDGDVWRQRIGRFSVTCWWFEVGDAHFLYAQVSGSEPILLDAVLLEEGSLFESCELRV